MHRDKFAQVFLRDDGLLLKPGGGTARESVVTFLWLPLVGREVVAEQLRGPILFNNADIDVTSGAEIVEDTGHDGLGAEVDGRLAVKVRPPGGLEHGHGGQRPGAHGHVGKLIGRPVRMHREEVRTRWIHACNDQVCADVSLVPEEVLLEHRHARHNPRRPPCRQRVQLNVGTDQRGRKLRVGGSSCARAPDLGSDIVQLLAVLIGDDRPARGAGVCGDLGRSFRSDLLCSFLLPALNYAMGWSV